MLILAFVFALTFGAADGFGFGDFAFPFVFAGAIFFVWPAVFGAAVLAFAVILTLASFFTFAVVFAFPFADLDDVSFDAVNLLFAFTTMPDFSDFTDLDFKTSLDDFGATFFAAVVFGLAAIFVLLIF